jgi:hypothetical protein
MEALVAQALDAISGGNHQEAIILLTLLFTTADDFLKEITIRIETLIKMKKSAKEIEKAIKDRDDHQYEYSCISEALIGIYNTIPISFQTDTTISELRDESNLWLWHLYNWAFIESKYNSLRETSTITRGTLNMKIASIFGDGACGFRSIITMILYTASEFKVLLPHDPAGIHYHIRQLKLLICKLVDVILVNPENIWFKTAILSVPQNRSRGVYTIEQYKVELMKPAYYMTNYEIRMIAILLNRQINVVLEVPTAAETHQSITPPGLEATEVANGAINIIRRSHAHFDAITNITSGVLHTFDPEHLNF